ncbi:MAG: flagellar biosynthetic protein FliQ [Limisphaerales bacterium]|jgi:flagellar biosynthetic protein FliQ
MTPELAVELLKQLMMQAVALASPILMTALTIGLAVSLFQAVTSIHEPTLSFVPKALGIMSLLMVILPWLLRTAIEFTRMIIERMPEMTH